MKYFPFLKSLCCLFLLLVARGEDKPWVQEIWSGVPQELSLDDFVKSETYFAPADQLLDVNASDFHAESGYVSRIRGLVKAPVTGRYKFWLGANHEGRLSISTQGDKFSKKEEASLAESVRSADFDRFDSQESRFFDLVEGQEVFVELLQKSPSVLGFSQVYWSYEVNSVNWAREPGVLATQSSSGYSNTADHAVNGDRLESSSITNNNVGSWWALDLGSARDVSTIVLYPSRKWTDARYLSNFRVSVFDELNQQIWSGDYYKSTGYVEGSQRVEFLNELGRLVKARYIKIELLGKNRVGNHRLMLGEVEVFGPSSLPADLDEAALNPRNNTSPYNPGDWNRVNWALNSGAEASQKSTYTDHAAARAIDGYTSLEYRDYPMASTEDSPDAWWQVDLGGSRMIDRISIWNQSGSEALRLSNFRVSILDSQGNESWGKDYYPVTGFVDGHEEIDLVAESGGLVEGQVVKVQYVGASRTGENSLNLSEVEVFGPTYHKGYQTISAPRQQISSQQLLAYPSDLKDLDGDELSDEWEDLHGFDSSAIQDGVHSPLADADGDFLNNYEESLLGTNPFVGDSLEGKATYEEWDQSIIRSSRELYLESRIYEKPTRTRLLDRATTGPQGRNLASRIRGYITAPETGNYRFWLSGRSGLELYLSTDETKYKKRRIAELNPEKMTSQGVWYTHSNFFDRYSSQLSEEIYLEEGQKYFFETIQAVSTDGLAHVSLAWARPGKEREFLDFGYVSSYHQLAGDQDDDCLPDEWEVLYGLNPEDNGGLNHLRDGERGDYDNDGLTNHEEYLLGTNPTQRDTDGDGYSDLDEVRSYLSDPTQSSSIHTREIQSVNLLDHYNSNVEWSLTSQGLISSSFRSGISFNVEVPEDGYYFIESLITLMGTLRDSESLNVQVSIDGQNIEKKSLFFAYGASSLLSSLTPFLEQGTHKVTLFFNNYTARRNPVIKSLKLVKPTGVDSNGNQIPDWIESQVAGRQQITFLESSSMTSPAFVEGVSLPNQFPVVSSTHGHTALRAVTSSDEWFTNVNLSPEGSTSLQFDFNDLSLSRLIQWETTDLNNYKDASLTVRLGDSLKLGGDSIISYEYRNQPYLIDAAGYRVHKFSNPGKQTLAVTTTTGDTFTVDVNVLKADLADRYNNPITRVIKRTFPIYYWETQVSPDLTIDGGDSMRVNISEHSQNSAGLTRYSWTCSGQESGFHGIAARLYPGGPVLNVLYFNYIQAADAVDVDLTQSFVSSDFPNNTIIRTPIIFDSLPEGATVRVTIFRSGVTFLDGSQVKILEPDDFIDGVANLEFLFPRGARGGYCHYTEVFDKNGRRISRF